MSKTTSPDNPTFEFRFDFGLGTLSALINLKVMQDTFTASSGPHFDSPFVGFVSHVLFDNTFAFEGNHNFINGLVF